MVTYRAPGADQPPTLAECEALPHEEHGVELDTGPFADKDRPRNKLPVTQPRCATRAANCHGCERRAPGTGC